MSEENKVLKEAQSLLNEIKDYDLEGLARTKDLGTNFSLESVIPPARKIVDLFGLVPISALDQLPDEQLGVIKNLANQFLAELAAAHEFNPVLSRDTGITKETITSKISDQYQHAFSNLFPIISFLTIRTTDFSQLEADARATVKAVQSETKTAKNSVSKHAKDAAKILTNIRETAAEQGVSQQAIFFADESKDHTKAAFKWMWLTIVIAILLGGFAIFSVSAHKWSFLSPENTFEMIQLSLSKVLVFGAISYMLILSARNFMAHKHNAVVNKHRQNALATFRALVDAATTSDRQDIVLAHAAECIFTGRDTAFSKPSPQSANSSGTILQTLPRAAISAVTSDG